MKKPLLLLLLPVATPVLADPPPVERATVVSRAEWVFDRADTNHDGYLSKAEYVAALDAIDRRRSVTPTAQGWAAANAQFDAIDRAHTGRIPRAQFIGAATAHFDGADLDHDGIVTPGEARKAAKIKQKALEATKHGAPPPATP